MGTTATAPQNQPLTRQQQRSALYAELPLYEPNPMAVSVRTLHDAHGERMLTAQELAWVDAMLHPATCAPTRAAEAAGYADPAAMGSKLRRRLSQVVEAERACRKANRIGSVSELLELMWDYARGGEIVGYANARASQETLAKINGVLTDKVDLRLDRDSLRAEMRALAANAPKLLEAAPDAGETL